MRHSTPSSDHLRASALLSAGALIALLCLGLALSACGADTDEGAGPSAVDGGLQVDGAQVDGGGATDGAGGGQDAAVAADGGPGATADVASDGGAEAGPPYAVGVTTLTTIGANGRELPTEVWYPIAAGSQGKVAKYLGGLVPSPYGAVRDVPALPGPFPIFAFSHGNGGVREQSVFLMEGVARMGYVVISPDHIGNTLTTMKSELTAVMLLWRPQDLKAAIDRVSTPEKGDPAWLTGLVQPEKVAVGGHSFGGYTALAVAGLPVNVPPAYMPDCKVQAGSEVCKELDLQGPPPWNFGDPRVKLSVPLAHALYGAGALDKQQIDKLEVPVVAMAATGDTTTPYKVEAEPLYADLQGVGALLVLQGGSHFSFANMCEVEPFAPADVKKAIGDICKATAVPTMAQTHAIVLEHTLAALDIWLKGQDAPRAVFDPAKATEGLYTLKSKGIWPK